MFSIRLRTALVLVLIGAVTAACGSSTMRAEQPSSAPIETTDPSSHTDLYGDPLPSGALVRMGTIRLRHRYAVVAFSKDGKSLFSAAGGDKTIRSWDAIAGREKRRIQLQEAEGLRALVEISTDGKIVAGWTEKSMSMWDAATGKLLCRIPIGDDRNLGFALSPSGGMLAARLISPKDRTVRLWDARSGKELHRWKHEAFPMHMTFSPDDKILATATVDKNGQTIHLWDTASGKLVRKLRGKYVEFSPDGRLIAGTSIEGVATVWNVADGQERAVFKPDPPRYLTGLAFSLDNKILAVRTWEDVILWDIASCKEIRKIPAAGCRQFVFSPDGKTAASCTACAIRLWDLSTGKEIGPRPGHEEQVNCLAISPDGKVVASLAVGQNSTIHLWDAASGKLLALLPGQQVRARTCSFSADGRFLASGNGDETVCLWDVAAAKQVRTYTPKATNRAVGSAAVTAVCLSPQGDRIAALSFAGASPVDPHVQIHVWDAATGKVLTHRLFTSDYTACFAPDGRRVFGNDRKGLTIQDTFAGRQLLRIEEDLQAPFAFSPDRQVLAATRYQRKPLPPVTPATFGRKAEGVEAVVLIELATGKHLLDIKTGPIGYGLLAFAPDSRTIATAHKDAIRLWDAATGKELFDLSVRHKDKGNEDVSFVTSLAYLPDGRLATGLTDGTVLIWELAPGSRKAGVGVKDLNAHQMDRLWSELAGDDAGRAYQAIWTLAAVPAKTTPLLRHHLHPVSVLDAKQVQRFIDDLDSPEFTVRENAQKKLASFGEQAEPMLRQALEGKPSLEMRKRLESLHADVEIVANGIVRSKEILRTLRAIRVLEHICDQESRRLLQKLASGDAAARSTRQAKEALLRLERR